MRKGALYIIIIFSLVGIAGSWIATQRYFEIRKSGFEEKSFCNISEYVNCDTAFSSPYAKLGKIPVSGLGFFYYLWMTLLALWILAKEFRDNSIASFAWALSLGGLFLSLYKAYIAFLILHVLCLVCLSHYISNLVLLLAWHQYIKIGFKNWGALLLKPKFVPLSLATLAVMGLGWFATDTVQSKIAPLPDLGVSPSEVARFHFRQQTYAFEELPGVPVWGNPDAKVVLVEFSDFQCPFCKRAAFHIKPVLNEFKKDIRFYFYHFPLDAKCNSAVQKGMHDKACDAAFAAVCADQRGDFWGYHDDIFRKQKELSLETLLELAKKRGWEEASFRECMQAPETLKRVQEQIAAGQKIFVQGTPTILVNNRKVEYWTDPEILRTILKEEILRSGPKP